MHLQYASKNNHRLYNIAFWLILIIAVFLRCYQYFINRSLWHDEAHLALNFVDLGYKGLTQPLENYQSAPILFLFSVETCSRIFGLGEMALRFTPFILSVAVIPLFYFFVLELTKSRVAATIAFLIYAINLSFVYYASEMKPYTIDVSVYIILGYQVLTQNKWINKYRTLLLSITGIAAIGLSNACAVILAVLYLYFIIDSIYNWGKKGNKKKALQYLLVSSIWAVFFAANYFRFIYHHPYAEGMKEIWASSFCPTPLFSKEYNTFITEYCINIYLKEIFLIKYDLGFNYIFGFLILAGIVISIYKKQYTLLLFTVLPCLLHLVLSMFKMYPFYYRFILYTAPGIIILLALALSAIIELFRNNFYRAIAVLFATSCLYLTCVNSILGFPKWEIKIKPALAYINSNYPNTTVFVTTPSSMYEYYYKTGFEKNGNFKFIKWNLDADAFLNEEAIKSQHNNYIVLHSVIGGDNADVFIPGLKKRGLVVKEFSENNFGVTELKPLQQ